jgi:hypothetical protein
MAEGSIPPQIANLCQILQGCLSPQQPVLKAAEEQLKQLEQTQGQASNLLQIAVFEGVDLAIRQVAAISFKNLVSRGWGKQGEDNGFIPPNDKEVVKQNVLLALVHTPPLVRVQIAECIKSIIYCDYPEKWPGLLNEIFSLLSSQEPPKIYAALYALRMLTRKYEYKNEEDRVPLYNVVNSIFPTVIQIFQQLIATEVKTLEVVEMLKLCLKVYWSTIYLSVPQLLMQEDHFNAWMNALKVLLECPVPAEAVGNVKEQWWKVKKWVLHIINRLFNKFDKAKRVKEDDPQYPFAVLFEANCSCQFLQSIMNMLAGLTQGQYISERATNLALQYLTHALPNKTTYGLMKPHFQQLMFNILFPMACFSDEDAELWEMDPHEYVRKGYDLLEDLYTTRSQVIHFFMDMTSCKTPCKENLPHLINHIGSVFMQFMTTAGKERNPALERQMDGALLILGSLSEKLKTTSPWKEQVEQILHTYVAPVTGHPVGFLRAKGVWCLGMFADFKFAEGRGKGQAFSAFLSHVVSRLQDPDLPVRVDASVALRYFVEAVKDLDLLRGVLPQLLNEFMKLINEIENDDLIHTLEAIVEKFGDEIAPYATTICQQLTTSFWKCMDGDDDDDMGALAALGVLRALGTILESISSIPEMYTELEPLIFPIMYRMLSTEGQDVFEEILELISYFTYYSHTISDNMWRLWPMIVEAVHDWAIEYFENILVPLDNYISRGTQRFLTCKEPDYLASSYNLMHKVFNISVMEDDLVPAPRLMECILLHCKGHVDHYLEPYLLLVFGKLKNVEKKFLADLLIQVVANALYYNPMLTIQILQKHGVTGAVFQKWFEMIFAATKKGRVLHFKRETDKKINIIGLSTILQLPPSQLPPELSAGLNQIIQGACKLLNDLKELRDTKEADLEDEGDSSDEDDVYEEELEEEEDEDEGIVQLKASKMRDQLFEQEDEEDESDWEEDFYDYWDEEDEICSSPLDGVDAHVYFSDSFNLLQRNDMEKFNAFTATLDANASTGLQALLQHAVQRRELLSQAAANANANGKQ